MVSTLLEECFQFSCLSRSNFISIHHHATTNSSLTMSSAGSLFLLSCLGFMLAHRCLGFTPSSSGIRRPAGLIRGTSLPTGNDPNGGASMRRPPPRRALKKVS